MSTRLARRGTIAHRLAAPFNIQWAHACWFGDPKWTNPGDGNPIDSIRNQTGGGDPASTGTNRPTFRAAVAAYNNKPAAQFVGASSQYLDFDVANLAQPYSLVAVGNTSGGTGAERLIGTGNSSTNGGLGDNAGSASWIARFGVGLASATAFDANPHLVRAYGNGASSALAVDGTTIASGDAGTNQFTRLTLGAASATGPAFGLYLTGYIAFVGVASGDVTTQAGWADFKAWVASEYALTIA